jgi:hypothetical protein
MILIDLSQSDGFVMLPVGDLSDGERPSLRGMLDADLRTTSSAL